MIFRANSVRNAGIEIQQIFYAFCFMGLRRRRRGTRLAITYGKAGIRFMRVVLVIIITGAFFLLSACAMKSSTEGNYAISISSTACARVTCPAAALGTCSSGCDLITITGSAMYAGPHVAKGGISVFFHWSARGGRNAPFMNQPSNCGDWHVGTGNGQSICSMNAGDPTTMTFTASVIGCANDYSNGQWNGVSGPGKVGGALTDSNLTHEEEMDSGLAEDRFVFEDVTCP